MKQDYGLPITPFRKHGLTACALGFRQLDRRHLRRYRKAGLPQGFQEMLDYVAVLIRRTRVPTQQISGAEGFEVAHEGTVNSLRGVGEDEICPCQQLVRW